MRKLLKLAGMVSLLTITTVGSVQAAWYQNEAGWRFKNEQNTVVSNQWILDGGKWYYLDGIGYMQTGWTLVNGTWYYMDSTGAMQIGWQQVNGVWYYLNASGAMQTGWQQSGNHWYYLDSTGAMLVNTTTPDGYNLNSDGIWTGETSSQVVSGTSAAARLSVEEYRSELFNISHSIGISLDSWENSLEEDELSNLGEVIGVVNSNYERLVALSPPESLESQHQIVVNYYYGHMEILKTCLTITERLENSRYSYADLDRDLVELQNKFDVLEAKEPAFREAINQILYANFN